MSSLTFEHGIEDAPAPLVVDFHTGLAGSSVRYKRRLCSCGCQDPKPTLEFEFEDAT